MKAYFFVVLIATTGLAAFTSAGAQNQPSGNITKPNILKDTYFGDINGDGFDDVIQFEKNEIFAMSNHEEYGILHKTFSGEIKRLVIGSFAVKGVDQYAVLMKNGEMNVYSLSSTKKSQKLFSQKNFIADNEEAIVGDFTGNGFDDILVFSPSRGTLKLYTRVARFGDFREVPNFDLGNLSDYDLKNKRIYVGCFNKVAGRAGILIVNPSTGIISRYSSVTDKGKVTFWWAFHAKMDLGSAESLVIGKIDKDEIDDVLIMKDGVYNFYHASYDNGHLKKMTGVSQGLLRMSTNKEGAPFYGNFADMRGSDSGHRSDLVLIKGKEMCYIDALDEFEGSKSIPSYINLYQKAILNLADFNASRADWD